jgi:hypothetical protein
VLVGALDEVEALVPKRSSQIGKQENPERKFA